MAIIKLSELISASSTIQNIPAGNISATNIQSAINELDSEKVPISATKFPFFGTTGSDKSISLTTSLKIPFFTTNSITNDISLIL